MSLVGRGDSGFLGFPSQVPPQGEWHSENLSKPILLRDLGTHIDLLQEL